MEITCQMRAGATVTCQVPDDGPSALDVVTAIGTVAAVLIAAIAIVLTQRSIGRERRHQRLVERHRAVVELLQAFEALRSHRTVWGVDPMIGIRERIEGVDRESPELKDARARYRGLLWASEEALPINRNLAFEHIKFTDEDLTGRPAEGDPERESVKIRATRGEIVAALDDLRNKISKG